MWCGRLGFIQSKSQNVSKFDQNQWQSILHHIVNLSRRFRLYLGHTLDNLHGFANVIITSNADFHLGTSREFLFEE